MCDDVLLFKTFYPVQYLFKEAGPKQRLKDVSGIPRTLDLPLVGSRATVNVLRKYLGPSAHHFPLISPTEFGKTMCIPRHVAIKRQLFVREHMVEILSSARRQTLHSGIVRPRIPESEGCYVLFSGRDSIVVAYRLHHGTEQLIFVLEVADGLLNFGAATTTCEDLTGRKPLTLRRWVAKNRDAVLAAGRSAIDSPLSSATNGAALRVEGGLLRSIA
jgi:hypothetical protein